MPRRAVGNVVANDAQWVVHAWCARCCHTQLRCAAQRLRCKLHPPDSALNRAPRSVASGYEVAIASAGCKAEFLKSFLQRRIDADIFDDRFLNSTAVQTCLNDKTRSLTPIVQYYGLDNARQCAILFDDLQYNGRYATSIGMGFRWVDNGALQYQVGEPGITASDFFAAQAQWAVTCPDAAQGKGAVPL